MHLELAEGEERERDEILRQLVALQYERNDYDFHRGTFRVRGDVVEIFPVADESVALRVELFGDTIEAIHRIDPLKGQILERLDRAAVYPASHYVTPAEELERAVGVDQGGAGRAARRYFRADNRLLEAQRLEQRTLFDLEMLREIGYCHGIENYSRHLAGRRAGETPATLIDYFPKDTLVVIDESHVSVPQLRGMLPRRPVAEGGPRRVRVPAAVGVRQPAAHLRGVHGGGGPGALRLGHARGVRARRRPTAPWPSRSSGRPGSRTPRSRSAPPASRSTTSWRRSAPGPSGTSGCWSRRSRSGWPRTSRQYYLQMGLRVRYLHSDIDTLERVEVIRDLRLGKFDALVGINLLREGLDIPEVSLVAILDADKEGYLRSATSLVQTSGRAARNVRGEVIMYADKVTDSMRTALGETERRRVTQAAYNAGARHHPGVDPTGRSATSCGRSRSATTTPSRRRRRTRSFESAGGPGRDGQAARGRDEGRREAPRLRAGRRAPRPPPRPPQARPRPSAADASGTPAARGHPAYHGLPMDLAEKLERLPDRPGVYLYKDAKGQVVYVGKAASIRARVRSYFQASRTRDAKTDALVDHIADLDYIVTANELEALILESNLVKRHRPRYNIILARRQALSRS